MPSPGPLDTVAGRTAIIDAVPTAIVITDGSGHIALANAQAERLFGYSSGQLVGLPLEQLVPHRFRVDHRGLRAAFLEHPSARPMGIGRDLFALRKDGTELLVEIGLNPLQTEQGIFVVSAIVDIGERVRQAELLRQTNEALERSNIELRRFAYIASHDLQTPMRHIASFIELLRSTYGGRLDEQADDWIRRTVESIVHLQALIHDLLEYSRVDSEPRPFTRVSMRKVFENAVMLLEGAIVEAQAVVSCDELPTVMGDRAQLVQLMLNLIGNALKYRADQAPCVRVSAKKEGHEWIFAVRDNGIGIAPKHHEKIFELFQRLHDQQEYPGTGIGLAVCRRVVLRHGGRMWVESEPDRGSVFYFTLPEGTADSI